MEICKTFQIIVRSLVLSILIAALVSGQITLAADTITLAFQEEPSENPMWRWAELVYIEAFRRIGLEFHYKVYPAARASMMADSGKVDGEPARSIEYGKTVPNLIRLDEAVVANQIVAYVVDPEISLSNWESLRDAGYRVEYRRGSQLEEQKLSKVVSAENLSAISHPIQALKKLIAGRTDVFVSENMTIASLLASPEFKDSGIREAGVLQDFSSYPYLHKRHAALAPKLAEVLKQMKTEGVIRQYFQQAQQEFAQK